MFGTCPLPLTCNDEGAQWGAATSLHQSPFLVQIEYCILCTHFLLPLAPMPPTNHRFWCRMQGSPCTTSSPPPTPFTRNINHPSPHLHLHNTIPLPPSHLHTGSSAGCREAPVSLPHHRLHQNWRAFCKFAPHTVRSPSHLHADPGAGCREAPIPLPHHHLRHHWRCFYSRWYPGLDPIPVFQDDEEAAAGKERVDYLQRVAAARLIALH